MVDKEFKGFVILNYRSGNMRAVKKLSRKLKESEIPIEIDLKVSLPEPPKMKVSGELELGGTKVKQLILDALDNGEFKDDK